MNKRLIRFAAGLALAATALPAQTGGRGGRGAVNGFQDLGMVGLDGTWIALPAAQGNGAPSATTGRPLSATEERRTVQTLGDGTVLENADSNLFYRDSQGRTRVEQTRQGKTSIVITDPVAGFMVTLDPATKTALKSAVSAQAAWRRVTIAKDRLSIFPLGGRGSAEPTTLMEKLKAQLSNQLDAAKRTTREDLGTLNQYGVPAQGTRETLTIPAGEIGNNRDIHVINERWYSNELQMLVKSVNSDPRFGTTTYQLTNIVRVNPDSSLFQIPADYTVAEGGGRGRGK
jgi:hypothetical protein